MSCCLIYYLSLTAWASGAQFSSSLRQGRKTPISFPARDYNIFSDWAQGGLGAHVLHSHEPEGSVSANQVQASRRRRTGPRGPAKPMHEDVKTLRWWSIGIISFLMVLVFCYLLYILIRLFNAYRKVKPGYKKRNFNDYLYYRFENWFTDTERANFKIVLAVTLIMLLIGTPLYTLIRQVDVFLALWKVFSFLVDPGAAAGIATHGNTLHQVLEMLLAGGLAICGLVLFALLLDMLGRTFTDFTEQIAEGHSDVMESNHVVILGFQDEVPNVIQELCKAHEDEGGTTIVVLSEKYSKPEMDKKIQRADIELLGSTLIMRSGKTHQPSSLRKVGAPTAGKILIISDNEEAKEVRDAFALRTLTTLRSKGWPENGQIITTCSLSKNVDLFSQAGGEETRIAMLDGFLAKFMVQCSQKTDIAVAFSLILGFGGSEMYIEPLPKHLSGIKFSEAVAYFPNAVPVAVYTDQVGCTFCPGQEYTLTEGEEIVLIAEDHLAASASQKPSDLTAQIIPEGLATKAPSHTLRSTNLQTMVLIGWNELSADVVFELDLAVEYGSCLLILEQQFCTSSEGSYAKENMQKWGTRLNKKLQNFTEIHYDSGMLGSRFAIEDLTIPIEQATRIFLFADHNADTHEHADALTLMSVIHIRDIFVLRGVPEHVSIVPEIRNSMSKRKFLDCNIYDFIDSAQLPSQILATFAHQPRIMSVLDDLFSQHNTSSYTLVKLSEYICEGQPTPDSLSFYQVSAIVGSGGDVAVGWTLPYHATQEAEKDKKARGFHKQMATIAKTAHNKTRLHEYELNPADKFAQREWCWQEDRVIVITADSIPDASASPTLFLEDDDGEPGSTGSGQLVYTGQRRSSLLQSVPSTPQRKTRKIMLRHADSLVVV